VAWPVYTETFIRHRSLAAGTWSWTVPTGKRALVKSVVAVQTGSTSGIAEVLIGNVAVMLVSLPAGYRSESMELLAVAYGGQVIGAYASAANYDITVSGWLLDEAAAAEDPSLDATWERDLLVEALPAR
jgi:hypothetical protein